ncbi:MAG: Sensor histidine kinase LiaS [Firmicutes bacterium ADurb.Bin419]|nr:MAG: Sensor histidine kinase LiaS [Firmicutes bacterium ADurb.Bin419]
MKLILSVFLIFIITTIVEVMASPIIHIKGVTVYDVFDSFYINFIHSIPNLIVFFIIDFALYTKRKNLLNISVTKSILQSKVLSAATVLLMILSFVLIAVYTLILNDKLLEVYSPKVQMVIISVLVLFPAINLGGLWFLLYSVKFKEAMDKRIERDKFIKEVAVTKERNRLARDLHDTLGHSLTLTIKLLEVCMITPKTNSDLINKKLEEAIKIAQDGVQKVKLSVSGILEEKIIGMDLISSLTELANEFEKNSGISVDVSTQGTVEEINRKNAIALYSVCQEALTNSMRHGKAKNIAIIIKFDSEAIKLSVFDDGVGCEKVNKGFGINGMEQRIKEVNGKMSYTSDKEQGFILNFEVPKEGIA